MAVSDTVLIRRSLADPATTARLADACVARDLDTVRALAAQPALREAIEIASPALGLQLDRFLTGELGERRTGKLVDALFRYAMRMRHRATPLGMFAGVGALDTEPGVRRVIRPSASWCVDVGIDLAEHDEALLDLSVTASRAVYSRAGELIVLGAETASGSGYAVTTRVELIRSILTWCDGWRPARAVIDRTAEMSGAPPESARGFVLGMIRHGLLVTELAQMWQSTDPFDRLRDLVRVCAATDAGWPGWAKLDGELAEVHRLVDATVTTDVVPVQRYRELRAAMAVVREPADLHVDAVVGGAPPDVPDTAATLAACRALAAHQPPGRHPIVTAAARWFTDRYSDAHTVRLAEMFLPGAGFDITAATPPTTDRHESSLPDEQRFLHGSAEVTVTANRVSDLPPAFLAFLETSTASQSHRPVRLRNLSTGLQLLGRFAHLDPSIAHLASEFVRRQDELDDVVRAEIRCPCAGRSQNIALRPVLRDVCVDFGPPTTGRDLLGRDVVSLPVEDLLVRVIDGELRLYSENLGRRIIPSIATAVIYHRCLYPAAAFLTLLAGQESRARQWSWRQLTHTRALPRVVAGSVVLAPRQWTIDADDVRALRSPGRSPALDALAATRFVIVGGADSPLLLDIGSSTGLDLLERQVKGTAVVKEAVAVPDGTQPRMDRVATELVVPCYGDRVLADDERRPVSVVAPRGPLPTFGPGSRWASVKVYGRPGRLDLLLAGLAPLIDSARSDGGVRRWFFVRYSDPDHHLRLRFTGQPGRLWGEFVPALWRVLDAGDRLRDRVVADEYRPEVERYGGPRGLPFAESVFMADSALAIRLTSLDDEQRLRTATLTVHRLLTALGYTGEQRRRLTADVERTRAARHHAEAARILAGQRFRADAAELDERLWLSERDSAVTDWAGELIGPVTRLRDLLAGDPPRLDAVTRSLLHMQCNRMFPTRTNFWEVAAYSMARRAYDRHAAREARDGR